MFKMTVNYESFDEDVLETLYFHMSTKEWMQADEDKKADGGYEQYLAKATKDTNPVAILTAFEDIVRRSYGVKSEDGRRFIKSEEETEAFLDSLAYDAFLEQLISTNGLAAQFIKGLIPRNLIGKVEAQMKTAPATVAAYDIPTDPGMGMLR